MKRSCAIRTATPYRGPHDSGVAAVNVEIEELLLSRLYHSGLDAAFVRPAAHGSSPIEHAVKSDNAAQRCVHPPHWLLAIVYERCQTLPLASRLTTRTAPGSATICGS